MSTTALNPLCRLRSTSAPKELKPDHTISPNYTTAQWPCVLLSNSSTQDNLSFNFTSHNWLTIQSKLLYFLPSLIMFYCHATYNSLHNCYKPRPHYEGSIRRDLPPNRLFHHSHISQHHPPNMSRRQETSVSSTVHWPAPLLTSTVQCSW